MEKTSLNNSASKKDQNATTMINLETPVNNRFDVEYIMRRKFDESNSLVNKYCHVECCLIKNIPFIIIHFEKREDKISFKVDLAQSKEIKDLVTSVLQECDYLIFANKYDWNKFLNLDHRFLITELLTQTSIEDLELAILTHAKDNLAGPFNNKQEFIRENGNRRGDERDDRNFWEIEYAGKLYFQPKLNSRA